MKPRMVILTFEILTDQPLENLTGRAASQRMFDSEFFGSVKITQKPKVQVVQQPKKAK